MASGEVSRVTSTELAELPYGSAITSSGRISAVTEPGELSVHYPFPTKELVILDNALKFGSRNAKARFAVYIGDLGEDTAATARELLARVPTPDNASSEKVKSTYPSVSFASTHIESPASGSAGSSYPV